MGPDQRWVELRPKGAETSITLVTWFETMPAGSLKSLVLDTDDVRSDVETLKANGLSFTPDVTDDFWGVWSSFDDPDGNGWILTQAKEMPQG